MRSRVSARSGPLRKELRCRELDNCRKVVIAAPKNRHFVGASRAALLLHRLPKMILRIVEESDDEKTMLRLIGRIESEHVRDLKAQLANETRAIVLDLSEIKLVNQAAVRFLRLSEDKGIELRNCPAYIREWIRCDRRSGDETE
jgi:hypothetical protein